MFSCKSLHYYSLCFLLSFSPAGREITDSRHVFQNPVKSFVRVLSCNINVMLGNLRAFPRILACLSDLQIILSRKLAKSLSLENVILVRLCQLRVAVLSHFCHLQVRKKSVLRNGAILVIIDSWCLPPTWLCKRWTYNSVKHAVLKLWLVNSHNQCLSK